MAVMTDGFKTILTGTSITAFGTTLYEKTVTPPGLSGGGPNDTTTMRTTTWRTKQPKKLKTMDRITAVVAYDPAVYSTVVAQMNVNQQITVTFPDNSTLQFWGWLDNFQPGENREGDQPTATITIECSNQNNSYVTQDPVYTGP